MIGGKDLFWSIEIDSDRVMIWKAMKMSSRAMTTIRDSAKFANFLRRVDCLLLFLLLWNHFQYGNMFLKPKYRL